MKKKKKVGGLRFLNFKTYGKFENYQNGIKLRDPHLWLIDFWQGCQENSMGRE